MTSGSDWRGWAPWLSDSVDPYSHFVDAIEGEGFATRDPGVDGSVDRLVELSCAQENGAGGQGQSAQDDVLSQVLGLIETYLDSTRLTPRIPDFAMADPSDLSDAWLPPISADDAPDLDAVVVGVIDRGIALHHQAQRLADGKTRLVAAWQQIADRRASDGFPPRTRQLPFGLALLKPDIDAALAHSKLPTPAKGIDVEAFNTLVGSGDYRNIRGHRELGRAYAHGTHVFDAATGVNPETTTADDEAFRRRVRPMVVNLPDRIIMGLSSRHLSYFVILGLLWMVLTADRYWLAKSKVAKADRPDPNALKGYPILINLSFAKQAGSKDGDDEVSRIIRQLNAIRAAEGFHPVFVVTPSGNDNLARGNAHLTLPAAKAGQQPLRSLAWRIAPGDQSSNFVEVWFEAQDLTTGPELELALTDPMGRVSGTAELGLGRYTGLGEKADGTADFARIYCEAKTPLPPAKGPRLKRYLICVAPTLLHDSLSPEAPSGAWTITLKNISKRDVFVTLSVQTDQSELPGRQRSRLSYFDEPEYERHDPQTGRQRDTFNYPTHTGPGRYPPDHVREDYDQRASPYTPGSLENAGKIRRHGTMNALANTDGNRQAGVTIVGGYRLSDGKPAPYASTGLGRKIFRRARSLAIPSASYPSDDGYAHLGRLAAGSNDGTVRSMQGTSFAVAQMTRRMAVLLMRHGGDAHFRLRFRIMREAIAAETRRRRYPFFADPDKVGAGRLDMPPRNRTPRREP